MTSVVHVALQPSIRLQQLSLRMIRIVFAGLVLFCINLYDYAAV